MQDHLPRNENAMTENSTAPAIPPAAETAEKDYTVIGYWKSEERPVAVGIIEGDHPVDGGEDATGYGDWATLVQAPDAGEAEILAIAEMKSTLINDGDNEDNDDDTEEGA